MSEQKKAPGADLFEQAVKNYEQALKTGSRLQEECGKWWTEVLRPGDHPSQREAGGNLESARWQEFGGSQHGCGQMKRHQLG